MNDKKQIMALGFFDGVHLGHQVVLNACRELADEMGCEAAVVTFDRHPKGVIFGEAPGLLNKPSDKVKLLKTFGMDQVHVLTFNEEIMNMHWRKFVDLLLDLGAAGLVCGHDYHFGHFGIGNAEKLKTICEERGLPCVIIPEQVQEGSRVSSTRIRQKIEQGEMEGAMRLLGHPHMLTGTVVHGNKLGRTLGIPTANLILPEGLIIPHFGVYACLCNIDGKDYMAVTNIGTRPTVNGEGVTVEPWILDYEGNLYDREITLHFYRFLRPERKFDSLEELRLAVLRDADVIRAYFDKKL